MLQSIKLVNIPLCHAGLLSSFSFQGFLACTPLQFCPFLISRYVFLYIYLQAALDFRCICCSRGYTSCSSTTWQVTFHILMPRARRSGRLSTAQSYVHPRNCLSFSIITRYRTCPSCSTRWHPPFPAHIPPLRPG